MKKELILKNRLKEIRAEKKLSQQSLAEKCGFSNTTLSSYENGKKTPGLVTLANIAKELNVSIERLCYGDDNNAFINSVPDNGRKIVNSLFFLWETEVIKYEDYAPILNSMDKSYMIDTTDCVFFVALNKHTAPIQRLLKSLNDFSKNKETFSNPEAYIEMLLSSVATEINKEIEDELETYKKRKAGIF